MKIEKFKLFKYSLPLNQPLNMKGHLHNERRGLILELHDSNQNIGYGEAAPFPGLHNESLDELIDQFTSIKKHLLNINLESFNIFSIDLPECCAVLRFAIEWSIINLVSRAKNNSPAALLNSNFLRHININPILHADFDEIANHAKEIKKSKPLSVKIKVGFRALEDDIYLIKKIDDIFENKVGLRLDANKSWSINQAITFGHAVLSANLEYIEEPLNDFYSLQEFYKKTGIRYALDESLDQNSISDIQKMEGIAAFIIKPSVIGSLKNIKTWIDLARKKKVSCVFSNTFESGIGLWSNAYLAAAFSKENVAQGLDTYSWLSRDLIHPAFCSQNYSLTIPDDPGHFSVRKENLNLVDI